jgi:uncharacterized protein YjbI with pentapeptide repeats
MANLEHLALLKQGIKVWNEWRKTNLEIKPDLSEADLSKANLRRIDLSGANLSKADLSGTYLSNASLREASLIKADLSVANLRGADLSVANLRGADLSGASLIKADLSGASLIKADLSGADLSRANLREADLRGVYLGVADFSGADLSGAILSEAILSEADLNGTNLSKVDLSEADLRGKDLSKVDLSETNLSRIQALKTNFEGATFTGACIEDWNINSETNLNNVICDYVYLKEGKQERRPSDPKKNFAPGEFTKIFQEVKNTAELIFSYGINWRAFAYAFNEENIQVYNTDGGELFLREYKALEDGLIVLKVSVPPGSDKERVRENLIYKYELQIASLEGELKAKNEILAPLYERLLLPGIQIDKFEGELMTGDRNIQMGSGNYNERINGNYVQNNYYAPEQKQTLAEAAAEIQQLLEQLSETYPTTTSREKNIVIGEAVEQIEKNPTLKAKVINALKAGGIEAFKEAVNHPLVNIFVATIEGLQDAE